jgi:hypothetical protein
LSAAAGVGHNKPPIERASLSLTAEEWKVWLDHVFEEATARRAELLASYERFADGYQIMPPQDGAPPRGIEKWSDDVQGRAGDLRDKFRALIRNADALHTVEKAQVLVAQRAIDGFLRSFADPLNNAVREITRRQTVYAQWLDAESRRKAREEAERARIEAEAALQRAAQTLEPDDLQEAADRSAEAKGAADFAQAKPAEHTRVHGSLGSVTSLRTQHVFHPEDSDLMELAKAVVAGSAPLSYLTFNENRIKLAIRVEGVRHIPGCVIREEGVAR